MTRRVEVWTQRGFGAGEKQELLIYKLRLTVPEGINLIIQGDDVLESRTRPRSTQTCWAWGTGMEAWEGDFEGMTQIWECGETASWETKYTARAQSANPAQKLVG